MYKGRGRAAGQLALGVGTGRPRVLSPPLSYRLPLSSLSPTHRPLLSRPRPAEKPEHILHYSAAAAELTAVDGGPLSLRPTTVDVIVEKLHAGSGRIDRLSSPTLRPSSASAAAGLAHTHKNGFRLGGSGGGGDAGKSWWQHASSSSGGVTQVHAVAAHPEGLHLELPAIVSSSPPAVTPRSLARLEAVRSPTQQLLSRENSGGQVDLLGRTLHTAFDRALFENGGGSRGDSGVSSGHGRQQEAILLESLPGGSPRGAVQRR